MSIERHVPQSVLTLRTEAALDVINPWFEKSLEIPGDVVEAGCYRGTMSIKYAFWIKSLGLDKTVFALDTFQGFNEGDACGSLFNDCPESYRELQKWSVALPLISIKADVRTSVDIWGIYKIGMCSFVWLDLDIDYLLEAALQGLRQRITPETIIGLDDYGRPECHTVKPWADHVEQINLFWRKIAEFPDQYIAFYQKI